MTPDQELTSIRNQLAEAQRNVELLRGVNDEQQKRVFDLLSQRDQLKQKLAALTEALKPVREDVELAKSDLFHTQKDGCATSHERKPDCDVYCSACAAERALSEMDKLCAKGD